MDVINGCLLSWFYLPTCNELPAFERFFDYDDCPSCGKHGRVSVESHGNNVGMWFKFVCHKYDGGTCGWFELWDEDGRMIDVEKYYMENRGKPHA